MRVEVGGLGAIEHHDRETDQGYQFNAYLHQNIRNGVEVNWRGRVITFGDGEAAQQLDITVALTGF